MRSTTSIISGGKQTGLNIPLSPAEILVRVERRLAWYGLPHSEVRTLDAPSASTVVITLEVGGSGIYREELDAWTGLVRHRVLSQPTPVEALTANG